MSTNSLLPATQPELFDPADPATVRQQIFDQSLHAVRNLPPIENQQFALRLTNADYARDDRPFSAAEEKRAILEGRSLARTIRGTWELADKATGQVIAQRQAAIARVPYLTRRGMFINRGSDISAINQLRMLPAVFGRVKENGELESHFNALPRQGRGFKMHFDPATQQFTTEVGQANLPLATLIEAAGGTRAQMQEAWGREITHANLMKNTPASLARLYQKMVSKPDSKANAVAQRDAIRKVLEETVFDPDITEKTLGERLDRAGVPALLAASRKLLGMSRGEAEPDDRDSLAYQRMFTPADLFSERLQNARQSLQSALWKATNRKSLDHIPPGLLDDAIQGVLFGSGLAQAGESINPGQVLEQMGRVTRMGPGGIPSADSIPDSARSVQPSHLGFIDPVATPESTNAGVDGRLASGVRRGKDGQIYAKFRNRKTGQLEWLTPRQASAATIVFPGEGRYEEAARRLGQRPFLRGMRDGQMQYLEPHEIQYELPDIESAMAPQSNMVPAKSAMKQQRIAMGGRYLGQALPLIGAEAPLVRNGVPGKAHGFDTEYADRYGAVRAKGPGRVLKVEPGALTVQYGGAAPETIELYEHLPYNRKTGLHQTPVVQPGDAFAPGQLLVRSNFTDDQGDIALGLNAYTAYLADKYNYEDGITMSESLARRYKSNHYYQHAIDKTAGQRTDKKDFVSLFATRFDKRQLSTLDDFGVVRPGTEVRQGDPLILRATPRNESRLKVHSSRTPLFNDDAETWEHEVPGIVTDVVRTDKGTKVVVNSHATLRVGDKISGRYGDKGVVTRIWPDAQMPQDKDGRPYELLLNSHGVISRSNPSQAAELWLGKVAKHRGQPVVFHDFDQVQDVLGHVAEQLKQNGMTGEETVIDPRNGRRIPGVATGYRYMMKLHHTAESKSSGRSIGGYTAEGIPSRGGETGSKRTALLNANALLAHNAFHVLKDVAVVRGQANPELWRAIMSGRTPPPADVPPMFHKFLAHLEGAGIHVRKDGGQLQFMALRDQDVDELAGEHELKNAETVDWKNNATPIKGGLFDEALVGSGDKGGRFGRWAKITLTEPMPNPAFEEPIRRILELTENGLRGVLAGRDELHGKTGPQAIVHALQSIDLDRAISRARQQLASGKKTQMDAAVRKLGYLRDAKRLGLHPKDWVLSKVPVLPPGFRPVSELGDKKLPLVADANYLYRELFNANRNLRTLAGRTSDLSEERLALYDSFKALTGFGEPLHPKDQERGVRGLLKHVFGSSPKQGFMQYKLIGHNTDLVGRAVIVPDPELNMDQIALPERKAWEIYRPFIIRRLARNGLPPMDAIRHVEQKHPMARDALLAEMKSRPVEANRAPVWWKYGVMAFRPQLSPDDTLHISPLVTGGFGADFDGDTMQFNVPADDDAAREMAQKMLPSQNLLSVRNMRVHQLPNREFLAGLYMASAMRDNDKPESVYATYGDAIRAYQAGEIDASRKIRILHPEWSA